MTNYSDEFPPNELYDQYLDSQINSIPSYPSTFPTSCKNRIDKNDLRKWFKNTLIFSLPTLIVAYDALRAGGTISDDMAYGMILTSILSSFIDLGKKFMRDNS